jgi:hypothetical protein
VRSIPESLWHGPEAYGFRGQVRTCARIARVIEWEFGVRYHKDHVGRLLKALHWTPQQPIKRAIQRDDEAIRRWRDETWPELRRPRPAGLPAGLKRWGLPARRVGSGDPSPAVPAPERPCPPSWSLGRLSGKRLVQGERRILGIFTLRSPLGPGGAGPGGGWGMIPGGTP